jgi:hypothetical protein
LDFETFFKIKIKIKILYNLWNFLQVFKTDFTSKYASKATKWDPYLKKIPGGHASGPPRDRR